jgi:uncharacterized membrane protein YhaH (DUF805 family)
MLEAIKFNLAHLADFTGREDRPTFWWYVLFLVIVDIVLGIVVGGPMVIGSMSAAFHAAQSGASQQEIQAQMLQRMSGQIFGMVWISAAIKVLIMALSVAAFVRRLHDSNNSGWWAALAVAAQVAVFAVNYSMLGPMRDAMASAWSAGDLQAMTQQQANMRWLGLLGLIAPLIVLVFGVMKSSPGPNRYGEAPQAG